MVKISVLVLVMLFGCRDSSGDRFKKDESIGFLQTAQFDFQSTEGLLHVLSNGADSVKVRASAPDFSFEFTRKDPNLAQIEIEIENTANDFDLTTTVGQSSKLGPHRWKLTFSPENKVKSSTPELPVAPFQFVAFGDIQNGIDKFEDVVNKVNEQTFAEFVLLLGDLTQQAKVSEFEKVKAELSKIKIPVAVTVGNHDVFLAQHYQDFFGRVNYSFQHRGARFTSVDSSGFALDEHTWSWYKDVSEIAKDQTHIVFSHIAPTETYGVRGGQWRSRREANMFIARSVQNHVNAFFFGHLHTLDLFHLGGILTAISGGAGAFEEKLDGIGRHILKVSVNPATQGVAIEVVPVD